MTTTRLKTLLIVILLSFATLHGVIFWRLHDLIFHGYGDFASFYTAGKIVQHGQSARLYDRDLQWQIQQQFASSVKNRAAALPYIRPPFQALLFLPLASLDYASALIAWTAINVALLFMLPFLLVREISPHSGILPPRWIQALLCLGFYPIAIDLLQGQDAILLLLLVTLAFTSLQKGSELRSGVYLGLGLFKFHLVIPICLVLLLKRRTRIVVGFCCAAVCLAVLSWVLVGWPTLVAYPRYLWSVTQTPAQIGINSSVMPNIRGLLTPILGPRRVPLPAVAALLGISVLGIIYAARFWRNQVDSRSNCVGFSITIAVIIVTSFYTAGHDLVLLILPFLLTDKLFANGSNIPRWVRVSFATAAMLLMCTPLSWLLLSAHAYYLVALPLIGVVIPLAALSEGSVAVSAQRDSGQA